MSIGPPIHEIWLFLKLTLKIRYHSHWWSQISKWYSASIILSTHTHFVPCQSGHTFLRYCYFKIWPWKSNRWKSKVTQSAQHSIDALSFRFSSIGPTIHKIWTNMFDRERAEIGKWLNKWFLLNRGDYVKSLSIRLLGNRDRSRSLPIYNGFLFGVATITLFPNMVNDGWRTSLAYDVSFLPPPDKLLYICDTVM